MSRLAITLFMLTICLGQTSRAASWADELFPVRSHDFGTVARGADVAYKFQLKNKFKNDVHLLGVRSSCGCTTPSIATETGQSVLKTYEEGYVLARFDTHSHTGKRSATLTVTVEFVDKDGRRHRGEAQLRVTGTIRADLSFDPPSLQFDNARHGQEHSRSVVVTRTGKPNWRLTAAQSQQPWLQVEFAECDRAAGQVSYMLVVKLKSNAPVGHFREAVTLIAADPNDEPLTFYVGGHVVPEIMVTPQRLNFNDVACGQARTTKIVLRGAAPFKVTEVESPAGCVTADYSSEASVVQLVELTFLAENTTGIFDAKLVIHTDCPESGAIPVSVCANVVAAP